MDQDILIKNPKRLSLSLKKKHNGPSISNTENTNNHHPNHLEPQQKQQQQKQQPETSKQQLNNITNDNGLQTDPYDEQLDSFMKDVVPWDDNDGDDDFQMKVGTLTEQTDKEMALDKNGVWTELNQADWGSNTIMDDMDDDDDFVDSGTISNLSKCDTAETPSNGTTTVGKKKSKVVGEDVFTEQCVKTWQGSRIKAWEGRYLSPEGYYYRFVIPGEGQQNGGWSSKEHSIFMERYNEWVSHGWKIGASWGLFSKGIPHRVGYQCMNYYRKLLEKGKLKDDTYEIVDGKLKQIRKGKINAGDVPITDLGPEWENEDVKQEEKNVEEWLKQYHQRNGSATSRPISKPKPTPKPRIPKSTTSSNRTNKIASLVKNQHLYKRPYTLDDDSDDFLMETAEPEQAYLPIVDWTVSWNQRLEDYKAFFSQYRDKSVRNEHFLAKQKWRQGLPTTARLTNKEKLVYQKMMAAANNASRSSTTSTSSSSASRRSPASSSSSASYRSPASSSSSAWFQSPASSSSSSSFRSPASSSAAASSSTPLPTSKQASLSRFFTGVKKIKVKVDTPDELIHHTRIPNDLFSGVKQVIPLRYNKNENEETKDENKIHYHEVNDMMDCVELLDDRIGNEQQVDGKTKSQIEGLLVDPPWEYILQDDRNDGSCRWNLVQMNDLMENVLKHMSAGLIFIWTHKLIQADVVRMMYGLDCKYVENLVWFKKSINNLPLDQPCPHISSTKEILLIFKKGDGIELRHQRSADVIIDFEQPASQWVHEEFTEPKPPGVFDMIETLLPRGGYDEIIERGRFVELWAKRAATRRKGWMAFHQRKDTNIISLQDMTLEDMTLEDTVQDDPGNNNKMEADHEQNQIE